MHCPDTDLFDDAGVYHSSEIGIALGNYPVTNATVFQEALSRYVQHIWAEFAKDPYHFKAWPQVLNGTGALGGGVRVSDGPRASGKYLTIVPATEMENVVDKRCKIYDPIYDVLGH
jgi:carboxylesterase type B